VTTSEHSEHLDDDGEPTGRDRGTTFVELLVAVVLLGTIVVAALAGLRASITGTAVDEDSARAQAWLQAATDDVHATTYLACDSNTTAAIEAAYQAAVDGSTRPAGWGSATITLVGVDFLSRTGITEMWGPTCASGSATSPLYAQPVTIRVSSPDGDFAAEIEVIKSV
jgi:hypothetical protein